MQGDVARLLLGFSAEFIEFDSFRIINDFDGGNRFKRLIGRRCGSVIRTGFLITRNHQPSLNSNRISEVYSFLQSGANYYASGGSLSRVVRTGVPRSLGGGKYQGLVKVPFLLIIFGTVSLGGFIATRAYKKQKETFPSHDPFLP